MVPINPTWFHHLTCDPPAGRSSYICGGDGVNPRSPLVKTGDRWRGVAEVEPPREPAPGEGSGEGEARLAGELGEALGEARAAREDPVPYMFEQE